MRLEPTAPTAPVTDVEYNNMYGVGSDDSE